MKNIKVGIPGTLHEKDVNPASACMYKYKLASNCSE